MALSREDMLRELELLPMWQLRAPLAQLAAGLTDSLPDPLPEAVPAAAAGQSAGPVVAESGIEKDQTRVPAPELDQASMGQTSIDQQSVAHLVPVLTPVEDHALPDMSITLGAGRRDSIQRMDWQDLQTCVSACEACNLSGTRTQTVFGVGDPHADWLIVGEAPGAEEDRKGEPFVGQAGKLLDNMLAAIQLKRGDKVYIANVLKCRPPDNRDPHGEEVLQCDPFLKRQVELIQPKLILALGKFAAQSLLETDATIASLRGKLHRYQGVPVIVTYHPAYLLRNLPDKAKAWQDLCFAVRTMQDLQSAAASPTL
ncbi:uracil-DNA glycosylase [Methylobacillus flagellatus]|uniref:uracil-DNA glycosylase n=1 Tax=Methylobacillus flagellatus TaxID=405 RepID=UPI0010F4A32B|nr:uracil-DNA glycosylase [Methylobacillus flagellatus]